MSADGTYQQEAVEAFRAEVRRVTGRSLDASTVRRGLHAADPILAEHHTQQARIEVLGELLGDEVLAAVKAEQNRPAAEIWPEPDPKGWAHRIMSVAVAALKPSDDLVEECHHCERCGGLGVIELGSEGKWREATCDHCNGTGQRNPVEVDASDPEGES